MKISMLPTALALAAAGIGAVTSNAPAMAQGAKRSGGVQASVNSAVSLLHRPGGPVRPGSPSYSTAFRPTVADPTHATRAQLKAASPTSGLLVEQGPLITRSTVLARAQLWIDEQVPYSQTSHFTNVNGSYRQDCSGFVSMAWALPVAGTNWGATTNTLPEVATALGDLDSLRPGDMILRANEHVVLFESWTNSSHTTAVILEEAHSGTNARRMNYSRDYLVSNGFQPWRYKNIRENVTRPSWSFTGDAGADLGVLSPTGALAVRTNVDDGRYFDGGQAWSSGWAGYLGQQPGQGRLYFADLNGDHRTDMVVHSPNGSISVRFNQGTTFDGGHAWSSGWQNYLGYSGQGRLYFADLNADGRADLVVLATDGSISVRFNQGASFDGGHAWSSGWQNYLGYSGQGRLYFADINGDDRADLVVLTTDGSISVRFNQGASFDGGHAWSSGWQNYLGYSGQGRLYFADIDADGRADLVVHPTTGDIAVRTNTGTYFDGGRAMSSGWENYLGGVGQGNLYFN